MRLRSNIYTDEVDQAQLLDLHCFCLRIACSPAAVAATVTSLTSFCSSFLQSFLLSLASFFDGFVPSSFQCAPFPPSLLPSFLLSLLLQLFLMFLEADWNNAHHAGSSLLGRAKQLGPHSFVSLSLFPANDQLELAVPPLQTSFQAQTFCPEFHFRRQLPLQVDARLIRELSTQVCCAAIAASVYGMCGLVTMSMQLLGWPPTMHSYPVCPSP